MSNLTIRTVAEYQEILAEKKGLHKAYQADYARLADKKEELEERLEALEKAQAVVQAVAMEMQSKLQLHIESIVQTAIDAIFPGKYKFKVTTEIKNARTSISFYLEDETGNLVNPYDSAGGGISDIIAFALRLAVWSMGKTRPVMLLDEPIKNLSENLKPLAAEIFQELSQKLNIQIIMVTHDDKFIDVADKVFKVSMSSGKSKVSEEN